MKPLVGSYLNKDSKLENPNRELKVIPYRKRKWAKAWDSKLENPNRELKVPVKASAISFKMSDSKLENPNRELKELFGELRVEVRDKRIQN